MTTLVNMPEAFVRSQASACVFMQHGRHAISCGHGAVLAHEKEVFEALDQHCDRWDGCRLLLSCK